jgi:agmatine deiminase
MKKNSMITPREQQFSRRAFLHKTTVLAGAFALNPGSARDVRVPTSEGWAMPSSEAPHRRTWMGWPARPELYGGARALEDVRRDIARLARTIADFEEVIVLVRPDQRAGARALLGDSVQTESMPIDDLWLRDSGPIFVTRSGQKLAAVDPNFNGWGGRQTHSDDAQVALRIAESLSVPLLDSGLVIENGALEVDGAGTFLANESSIVNANRNPRQSRAQLEAAIHRFAGTRKAIWVSGVRNLDITDGHIDGTARFVRPGVAVVQVDPDGGSRDPWNRYALEVTARLREITDARGQRIVVHTLTPPQRFRAPDWRSPDFAASYANYYVCNGAVIVAEYGDEKNDARARTLLERLYPGRTVVQLNLDRLSAFGGVINCATKQEPLI